MGAPIDNELAQSVYDWIEQQTSKLQVAVIAHPDRIVREGNWLNVPVSVNEAGDAYDRASLLQNIEDLWEPADHDGLQLLLMPAKKHEPTKDDLYVHVGDLMDRQRQLLEQVGVSDNIDETAQRFFAIRKEWEATLNEMANIYPSLKR